MRLDQTNERTETVKIKIKKQYTVHRDAYASARTPNGAKKKKQVAIYMACVDRQTIEEISTARR